MQLQAGSAETKTESPSGRPSRSVGVFSGNKARPIHRWYPFIEGYSAELVHDAIRSSPSASPIVFDPFAGSGTTPLAAAFEGIDSLYCEVNPYLAWVADVKVNRAREASRRNDLSLLTALARDLERHRTYNPRVASHPLLTADERRRFFPDGVAEQACTLIEWIGENLESPLAELAKLACTTSLIPASNMVRRTDLRRRRPNDPAPVAFNRAVAKKLSDIHDDVTSSAKLLAGRAARVAADVRSLADSSGDFDLVVTSPPYLNGTNYCRNTKLELLALKLIEDEDGLALLRTTAITAGINNVSARRGAPTRFDAVEIVAQRLDEVAYDQRIPAMVRLYFSDMHDALRVMRRHAKSSARLLLDIGDSRFSDIHIPTDKILAELARRSGWSLTGSTLLRVRKSYDGSALAQVLLAFVAK